VDEVPKKVRALAEERERARAGKDYAEADRLRGLIRAAGFEVTDTASGPSIAPVTTGEPTPRPHVHARSDQVPSILDQRASPAVGPSVQWVVEAWPEDVLRSYRSVERTYAGSFQPVVVDVSGTESLGWYERELVRMAPGTGWAAARNAGLRRAGGEVVILVDGSVEFTGDGVALLVEALRDPSVGVTGPFGIVSDDLRDFRASEGPDVDAVEGYVMAFRREVFERGVRFDEKFTFYRTADIELCFQIKAMGLRATVTPIPVRRHQHRMWESTPEQERARLSKRNFYRFLDRWRGRTDLLVSGRS
jgi:cysteinyl-tRNA synthetase